MKIIRYIPDSIMGDSSPEEIKSFREFSLKQITENFPNHSVEISTEESTFPVWTDDYEIEDELLEFIKSY